MGAGVKVLDRVQFAPETTPGEIVPATTVWRGPAIKISDEQTKVRPEENIGVSSQTTRQYTPKKYATLTLPTTELTYEQFDHILDSGVVYNAGTQDGAGSGYIRTHIVPNSSTPPAVTTIKTRSIETGENIEAEVMEYSIPEEFELTGKQGEAWMITSKWFGRQAALQAFTSSVPVSTLSNPYFFGKSKLYVDAVGGTIGTTLVSNTFLGAKIKVTTGWKAQFTGDGNLYFSYAEHIGAKITIDITFLWNSTSAAQKVLFRSDTPRQIRIKTEGDALTSAGTLYSYRTGIWDFAGVWSQFVDSGESEGLKIAVATFEVGYDSTAALFAKFVNVNQLSAMP